MRFASLFSSILVLAIGPSACGGGSTSTDPTPATPLSGDYWIAQLSRELGTSPDAAAFFATISVAGNATLETSGTRISDDGVSTSTLLPLTVGTDAAGRLTIGDASGTFLYGTARSDGSMALAAADVSVTEPGVVVMVRRGGTHTVADLNGVYYVGNAAVQLGSHAEYRVGRATFDGAGTVTLSVRTIADGTVDDASVVMPYAVTPQGAVTLTLGSGKIQLGLAADRSLLVGIGDEDPALVPGDPSLWVFVKTNAGQTGMEFGGTYTMAGTLDNLDVGIETLGFAGTFTAIPGVGSAVGSGSMALFANGLAPGIPATGTVTGVMWDSDASGAIEAVVPDLGSLAGAHTADGHFGFLCGGVASGDNSVLLLFLRP